MSQATAFVMYGALLFSTGVIYYITIKMAKTRRTYDRAIEHYENRLKTKTDLAERALKNSEDYASLYQKRCDEIDKAYSKNNDLLMEVFQLNEANKRMAKIISDEGLLSNHKPRKVVPSSKNASRNETTRQPTISTELDKDMNTQ